MLDWLFDEFDELVYISDMNNYDLLYMNKFTRQLLGIGDMPLCAGMKCYEYLQGKNAPCEFCTNHLLTDDKFYRWEINNKKLSAHYVLKDRKIIWEGREARIEFAQDITEIRKQLDRSVHTLNSVIETVPGGVCQVDADDFQTVMWHNNIFLELIGYTKEQFINELNGKISYVYDEDMPKAMALMQEAKVSGKNVMGIFRVLRRDKTIRTLMISCKYTNESGASPVFYSVGIDITEYIEENERAKRVIEDALNAAKEASTAKGSFLSRMSHEIRTPLNAVIGMSAIAANSLDDKDCLIDCHKKIESAAKYLLSLINDILDLSKIESGKMHLSEHKFSISDLVHEIIALFIGQISQCGVTFSASVGYFKNDFFIGDGLRLKQVLVNLLSNAAKFTNRGDSISINVKQLSEDETSATFEFTVADTGIGMKPEFKQRAFDMFEQADINITTRYGGSGLGLAICKHITDLMHGTIDFESAENEGSMFKVAIPLKKCESAQSTIEHLDGVKVLVVETEDDCKAASEIFAHCGVSSDCVAGAEEALRKLDEHSCEYDAVILSAKAQSMPLQQFIECAKHKRPNLKILVSAYSLADVDLSINASTDVKFVQKPFFPNTLTGTLCNILGKTCCKKAKNTLAEYFKGKRILLVEDNKINLEIASMLLQMRGIIAEGAENGQEAVTSFRNSPEGYYDAILMDIRMPVMDGLTATRIIRESDRQDARAIPIIALSANAFDEEKEESRKCGMNDHISKPIDVDTLFATLAKYL